MKFTVTEFKLAVLSEKFSDEEIYKMFLNTVIEQEEDILEIVAFLECHLPEVLRKIGDMLSKNENSSAASFGKKPDPGFFYSKGYTSIASSSYG